MSNPPIPSAVSSMTPFYGCTSIADASGNLLFYTDGKTIWTSTHTVMANGSGLGTGAGSQHVLSVKKPGSNSEFFIFAYSPGGPGLLATGYYYSIVDMSLAGGQGSVTVKSVIFRPGLGNCSITGTRHCNGTDYWIVTRDMNIGSSSIAFRSFLFSSAGINTVSVNSSFSVTGVYGTSPSYPGLDYASLKISPNGKKLVSGGATTPSVGPGPSPLIQIYDFNNGTGIISNPIPLLMPPNTSASVCAQQCEFSPDGTKLYSEYYEDFLSTKYLLQWDLCAGSNSAMAASQATIATMLTNTTVPLYFGLMQLASNGKIYVSVGNMFLNNAISVINSPNSAGPACNFVLNGQSVAGSHPWSALPNMVNCLFVPKPLPPPFTYTAGTIFGCQAAQFSAPAVNNITVSSCASTGYSVTGYLWNFGDPLSAASNTSGLTNPVHAFSTPGAYNTQLILYYSCGGGTDTLRQTVIIVQPCVSAASTSITCASLGSATVSPLPGPGSYNYTWMPGSQTGSVVSGMIPGTYTISFFESLNNITGSINVTFLPLIPLTGSISASNSITCNSASTATGSISNLAGGSGSQSYFWTNGTSTSSVPNPTNLSAGNWSVTVTDALTACQVYSVFGITQPPALTLNIASSSASACAGTNITFTAINSGGTPAYTYTWVGAGSGNTRIVTQALAGNYVYTVNSRDANLCLSTKTIAVNFVPNPTLSVSNVSICPLETGTLLAGGASSYTWNGSFIGTTFTASPLSNQQYIVAGAALGCTATATASIIVKPVPSPTISNNSPVCNGQDLLLNSSGGVSYLWGGPNSYTSTIQNPTINPAAPLQSGVYNLTVTAANSCTAPATTTVLINPTPTISMSGGPVCLNSNLVLSANSFTGSSYQWNGPNSFTSSLQNPTIAASTFSAAGTYSLLVTSITSCSNTATVNVIVNSLPTISIVPSSTVICLGKSTNLSGSGGSTYLWNTSSTAATLAVSPTVNATYTVTGFSAAGCTNTAIQTISVNALPTLSVVLSPSVYCTGGSSTLTASGASTYTWSNNSTGTSIAVGPVFTSFYNVKGTDAITGCSNTAFATVSVNPLPVITASTTKSIICTGMSATLFAGGGNTYTWMPVNLSTTTIFPNPLVTTTYTVIGTNTLTGCQNTVIKTISVNITPTLILVSNTPSLCAGRSAIITPSGALSYTLNPGNLTGPNFTVAPSSTTQYSLSGTNSVNCVNLQPSNLSINVYSLTSITGIVTSTTGLNNGNVVLYRYKPGLGRWDSLATSLIITSNYNFPSVGTGTYVVKAFPFPTDIIETYGLSSSSWQGATIINHDCINPSTQNIDLITIDNTIKGKASLSGKISQGAGYSVPGTPGAPIANVIVKAGIHTGTTIVQRTRTNAQGNYTLANLMPNAPGKDYYILVDIPGLDTNTTYHRIIITGFENFTNLDFVVDSQRVTPTQLTVGIKELNTVHANTMVFPNPTSDKISIEFELDQAVMMSIELSDLSGRKVKDILSESKQSAGALTVLAGVSDLKEGMYLLNIRIGNEERVMKLVVQK